MADVKRKVPFYLSDFRDALSIQCLASVIFLYFACLSALVTFGGILGNSTENYMVHPNYEVLIKKIVLNGSVIDQLCAKRLEF